MTGSFKHKNILYTNHATNSNGIQTQSLDELLPYRGEIGLSKLKHCGELLDLLLIQFHIDLLPRSCSSVGGANADAPKLLPNLLDREIDAIGQYIGKSATDDLEGTTVAIAPVHEPKIEILGRCP